MEIGNRVGVRELRQNLSVYLRRVKEGEVLEVTERNEPVAFLSPIPVGDSDLERLRETGRVRAGKGALRDLTLPRGPVTNKLSKALEQERSDRL
jgi:prevent-host-death family protein